MELVFTFVGAGVGVLLYHIFFRVTKSQAQDQGKTIQLEAERRAYQSEVLREIGERIGYSLDVAKIIEIITGSLGKLLPYHTVSHMVKSAERIVFKCILRESVNRAFVEEVKMKMLAAFSAMVNEHIDPKLIDENITGTIFDENFKQPVRSFFNLPLVISGKVEGVITVASPTPGLYTEEETSVLYSIAQQASTAVTKLNSVLENEKGKLNALVASLTDGILMVDPSWNLLVANLKLRKLLDLPATPITLLDILDKISGTIDLRTKVEESLAKNSVVRTPEIRLGKLTLELFTTPVKDNQGKAIGAVVVFHDITQEQQIVRMREEFSAMMIHELRSPLNNVRSTAESLAREAQPNRHQLEASLGIIQREVKDMLNLVNDLLDVAKLEANKFTLSREPANLDVLIREVVDRHLAKAREKNLELVFQPKGDLNSIPVDAFRIRQVLTNLITNAIKFSQAGTISVSAIRGEHEVRVALKDTGPGMTKEDLARLFTKFGQLHHPGTSGQEGTGLGLVICRGIVEAHQGKIWAESELGEGTTVAFTLPL